MCHKVSFPRTQQMMRVGFEPRPCWSRARRCNHSTTLRRNLQIYNSDKYASLPIEKNTLNYNYEDIRIQISYFNTKENFYLGVIYCHPKSNITNFISAFNDKLIQLGKRSIAL